jgi:hypothetical protein
VLRIHGRRALRININGLLTRREHIEESVDALVTGAHRVE